MKELLLLVACFLLFFQLEQLNAIHDHLDAASNEYNVVHEFFLELSHD